MTATDPTNTSVSDIVNAALFECGAIGVGQTPLTADLNDAWARLQWMLQQWERKRWMVYHLVDFSKVSTGAQSYTVGPGGDFDVGTPGVRPGRLNAAFTRQLQGTQNSVDYRLEILKSREDYDWITLKGLIAGPGEAAFLDTDWPLAKLYVWPVPQAGIYEIHISIHSPLPASFSGLTATFNIPYEYYLAMVYNLAQRLRPKYRLGTYPGDPLPGMAKDSLQVVRTPNTQIARLRMPSTLRRRGQYNIYSDRPY